MNSFFRPSIHLCITLLWCGSALGATPDPHAQQQLSSIRLKVMNMQQELLDGLKAKKAAQTNVKKIKTLLALQKKEREVGHERLKELEKTVQELESRRASLNEKIALQQNAVRRFVMAIELSLRETETSSTQQLLEAPRRKVLANLADRSLKESEMLRIDLDDADQLERKIQDEKQQLAFLFQDLKEQESVLELNQQLQSELLKKTKLDRITQLENYRKLKSAESQVERLMTEFSARSELQRETQLTERIVTASLGAKSGFENLRGHLPLPVSLGKIVSEYGRVYDPDSRLYVFKKGVDIQSGKEKPVSAVFSGKVAFAGTLPDYGRVAIIDHGDHFYSLCAHLGKISRKAGDPIQAGEVLGETDDSGTPVYFEIRSRNVAVNPLQWFAN